MDIETYSKRFLRTHPAILLERTLSHILSMPKGSRLLDVGCAEGSTFAWLIAEYEKYLSYYGVDLSRFQIARAAKKQLKGADFLVGNVENLSFKDGTFDCVLASQIVEHVPDEQVVLQEISRVLKIGGYFQVDTVFKKKWAWYFRRSPAGWALDPTHLREYTRIEHLTSKFPSNLEIEDVQLVPARFRLNSIKIFSFVPDSIKVLIPGYYLFFVTGRKKENG